MTLLKYECRKLARMVSLWVFLALCLLFNLFYISTNGYYRQSFNSASETAVQLGQRIDNTFLEQLSQIERTKYQDLILAQSQELTNIFASYDTAELTELYRYWLGDSLAEDWIAQKYEKLTVRVDHLAETGAAMDLYAGPITRDIHDFLFGQLMRIILVEAAVLGMLSMLALLGHEEINRTTQAVCASRTGRKLFCWKVLAGLMTALALYLLIVAVTMGVYFALWDYSGVWNASISSGFNALTDMMVSRPVLTWADFTVAGYLAAVLALGVALTVVFSLLAAVVWTLLKRIYLTALALIVLCMGALVVPSVLAELKLWTAYAICTFQPVLVALNLCGWFTEMGMSAFIPWQETVVTLSWLTLLAGGTVLLLKRMNRKDLPA